MSYKRVTREQAPCRTPCATCPWRRDKHADTIPRFRLDKAEALRSTTEPGLGELSVGAFACHQSQPEQEVVCVGWLWRYGWESFTVRMRLLDGRMRREELDMPAGWDDVLHRTFDEVIKKLRADVARMEGEDAGL